MIMEGVKICKKNLSNIIGKLMIIIGALIFLKILFSGYCAKSVPEPRWFFYQETKKTTGARDFK